MFIEDGRAPYRERMQKYIADMALAVAMSTHKDILQDLRIDQKAVHEVAALAVRIALEKYDTENRTIVAQADSFERMAALRNNLKGPMSLHLHVPSETRK